MEGVSGRACTREAPRWARATRDRVDARAPRPVLGRPGLCFRRVGEGTGGGPRNPARPGSARDPARRIRGAGVGGPRVGGGCGRDRLGRVGLSMAAGCERPCSVIHQCINEHGEGSKAGASRSVVAIPTGSSASKRLAGPSHSPARFAFKRGRPLYDQHAPAAPRLANSAHTRRPSRRPLLVPWGPDPQHVLRRRPCPAPTAMRVRASPAPGGRRGS